MEPSIVDEVLGPAWERTDRLFSLLAPEAWPVRAIPLRHPPVFYLGHLAAFAWNHVGVGVLGLDPHDAALDALFERGIDPLTDDAASDATIQEWPSIADIVAYRDAIRDRLRQVAPDVAARADDDPLAADGRIWWLVREHEEMHHETLLYLFSQLDPRHLRRPTGWPRVVTGPDPRPARWVPVQAGPAVLGEALSDLTFGWDNELPRTTVPVDAFLLQDVPVTVGRWQAFVQDGGYTTESLWEPHDWAWRTEHGLERPQSWRVVDGSLQVRSLFAWHPLDEVAGWPVLVSLAEARAFARWSQARLPTEAELARAAFVDRDGTVHPRPPGDAAGACNLDFASGGLEPVLRRRGSQGPWGHHELVGNCWEWTDTPFAPLTAQAGEQTWHHTYPGYSTDFYDGQHYVVAGASWATARGLARRSFRNWYQPHYPYAFAGLRLARDG